ncbi:hypothetical protein IAU59_001933 [Kwoniella sp. CBS 9459]
MSSVAPRRPLAPLDIASFQEEAGSSSSSNNAHHINVMSDGDDTSSDEEDGVFLGAHKPNELSLLLKLSTSPSACSSVSSTSSPCASSPVPAIRRVKKRDSREFLRRKTLLLSLDRTPAKVDVKPIFTERRNTPSAAESDSSEDEQSPSSSSSPSKGRQSVVEDSDLTLDFAAFHLSTPRPTSPSSTSSDAGSDKENAAPVVRRLIDVEIGEAPMITITQEQLASELEEDEIVQLDMGGLRLSDFSDPETGLEQEQRIPSPDLDSDSGSENENDATPTRPGDVSHDSMDSPLPVARAGPVIIPVIQHYFASSIRADSSSPCRSLPPAPIDIDQPMEPVTSPLAASASPQTPIATPSRGAVLPPPDLVERGARLLKSSTITSKPAAQTSTNASKSASRVLAIRGQLNSAVSSRFSAMGPPQRTVSSSSGSSSGSGPASSSQVRPQAKSVPKPDAKHGVKPVVAKPSVSKTASLAASTTQKLPRPPLSAKKTVPAPFIAKPTKIPSISSIPKSSAITKPSMPSTIPLKRPAPAPAPVPAIGHTPALAPVLASPTPRQSVLAGPSVRPAVSRPNMGQPSRMFQPPPTPQMVSVPIFSVGVAGEAYAPSRPFFRSPGKSSMKRGLLDKGTPRKLGSLGTPMRFGTPRQAPPSIPSFMCNVGATSCSAPAPAHPSESAPGPAPIHDVSAVPESLSSGPPASATRHATENAPPVSAASSEPPRGSSEDYEGVSMQLSRPPANSSSPASSPPRPDSADASSRTKVAKKVSPKRASGRPKRAVKPPSKPPAASASASALVAGVSEKELKRTTERNTAKNQVYHCAIDRQVVFQPGPRPPSPTSKIRTTAERDEEEKKAARGDRARRRKGEDDEADDGAKAKERWPVIEKMVIDKAPGDDEDFVSPPRPAKKVKTDNKGKNKAVKWDRGLTVIRDDGSVRASRERSREDEQQQDPPKGCLKSKTPLDQHGNVPDSSRPVIDLKRTRIVVTAVFYDGEEPVPPQPAPASATRSRKK